MVVRCISVVKDQFAMTVALSSTGIPSDPDLNQPLISLSNVDDRVVVQDMARFPVNRKRLPRNQTHLEANTSIHHGSSRGVPVNL